MSECIRVTGNNTLKLSTAPNCDFYIGTVEDNLLVTYTRAELQELGGLLTLLLITGYLGRILIRAISGNA